MATGAAVTPQIALPQGDERPTDAAAPSLWTPEEAKAFFEAFQRHGTDWEQVARAVPRKDAEACEGLYKSFKSYLSLPKELLNVTAFLAVVKDSLKMEESEADTVSEEKPEAEPGAAQGRDDGASKPVTGRRSQRVAEARQSSPVWGGRRPRHSVAPASDDFVYESPTGRGRRGRSQAQVQADLMDAEGIDALLSLATVAQEASHEMENGEKVAGRPVRTHRRPRRHGEEEDDAAAERSPRPARGSGAAVGSPPGRARTQAARQQLRSPASAPDPLPPRTPSSRAKREKAAAKAAAAQWEGGEALEAGQQGAEEAEEEEGGPSSSVKPRSRRRRQRARASEDEDYELRPAKRGRNAEAAQARRSPQQEADLEAEDEVLEEEEQQQQQEQEPEMDWSKHAQEPAPRRRSRKSLPERAPPMMASAKSLFSRRSSIAFATPPPAFLLGVPPPGAHASAVETEGQTTMGPAEVRLRNCLDPRVRRWCAYEFFCSALDRPWFLRNELRDFMRHVGIPDAVKLTRPELSIIRASLGRPRRLSLSYLRQERIKLQAWRERVRATYRSLEPGAELPSDVPSQLQVGQRVTARHPVTHQLHDGDVLTVAPEAYRVQFDRRELGVELVKDTDVMPADPTDNLPAVLLQRLSPQALFNGRQVAKGAARPAAAETFSPWAVFQRREPTNGAAATMQGFANAPVAIRSLAEMKAALDYKELLLAKLKRMNDEVDAGMHGEVSGRRPEAFQKAYAQVVVDLQLMNKLLDSAAIAKPAPAATQAAPAEVVPAVPVPAQQPSPAPQQADAAPQPQRPPNAPAASVSWDDVWRASTELVKGVKAGQQEDASKPHVVSGRAEPVVSLVTGCLSLLLGLQQCTAEEQSLASFDAVTSRALQAIKPQRRRLEVPQKNAALYTSIQEELATMRGQRPSS